MGPARYERGDGESQWADKAAWGDPGTASSALLPGRRGGQTQAELSKNIQVEQPTMANILSCMERDGLIYRVACDQDKRQSTA